MSITRSFLICFTALAVLSSATHFRFGTIDWVQTPNPTATPRKPSTGRDVTFTITSAWRKTFFNGGNFNVGNSVTESTTYFYPDQNNMLWGSGTVFTMLVNVVNNASDWFIATQTIYGTYAANGNYIATFFSCCRISNQINNPNGYFKVTAQIYIVNGGNFKSINSQVVPIVNAGQNQQLSFRVGVIAYQNEFLGYRLATAAEASSNGVFNQINGLNLDFNTGLITWTPTAQGYYSLQVIVMGYTAQPSATNMKANLQSYVAVDFLIYVTNPTQLQCKRFCQNAGSLCFSGSDCYGCIENGTLSTRTPYCVLNTPPFFTKLSYNGVNMDLTGSNNGSSLTLELSASFGSNLVLAVTAQDNNTEDYVSITSSVIPTGAVASLTPNANPSTLTINWTPSADQLGTVICFSATDSLMHTSNGLLCVRINLIAGTLAASGTGLTYAVAGQFTSANILDGVSRNISMAISGFGYTSNAVITPVASTSNGVTMNYTGSYNVAGNSGSTVTKAGFYSLQISDVTVGIDSIRPHPLSYSLQVVPAQTDPAHSVLYDQGSSGLTGGVSGTTLYFLLQARDTYDNNQLGAGIDNFTMTTSHITTVTSYSFVHVGNGVWNVTYQVPSSSVTDTYNISVYYANTTASTILVGTFTASILTHSFFISSIPTTPMTFSAGQAIKFVIIVAALSDDTQSAKMFEVTVNGNNAQVALLNSSSGNSAYYQVTAEPVSVAQTYFNGILVTAAGLNGNNPGVVNYDLVVIPSTASGANSTLSGSFVDLVAGESVEVTVNLMDVYGNAVTNGADVVTYTYSNTRESLSGNAVFSQGSYTFMISGITVAGFLTLNVAIAPSTANGNVESMIAQSPYTLKVVPNVFSFTESQFGGMMMTAAGVPQIVSLTSNDVYFNERNVDADFFVSNFTLSLGGNNYVVGTSTVMQIPGTGRYQISYATNLTGVWNLAVSVLKVEDPVNGLQAYVLVKNFPITVSPGPINPANARIFGSGLNGGTEGSNAVIMMQSRDDFGNVAQVPSGGLYIVKVTNPSGIPSYYSARYCSPGANTCPLNSAFDVTLTQTNNAAMNVTDPFAVLSTEELLYAAQGFWKINYPVPLRSATAGSNFTITAYYGNFSEYQQGDTAQIILARNSTVKVFGPAVASSSQASSGGGTNPDDWGVVALGVGSGAIVLSAIGYGAWRMQRYRPKYKEQKARADKAEQMLSDMADEVEVIPGGRDWDAVGAATVTLNPLHPAATMKAEELKRLQQIHDPQSAMTSTRSPLRKEFAPRKANSGSVRPGGSISYDDKPSP